MENHLRAWRTYRHLTQEEVATRANTNKAQISKLETGVRQIKTSWLERLGDALGVNPAELLAAPPGAALEGHVRVESNFRGTLSKSPRLASASQVLRDLPVRGWGRGDEAGRFFENGLTNRFVERPPPLMGVLDSYAIYIPGDSMEPALREGCLAYIDPHRPAAAGDLVAIQLTDGQAFLKFLVRRVEAEIRCLQFNPRKEITYKKSDVEFIHLIVMSSQIRM